jgi:hypothetical protein
MSSWEYGTNNPEEPIVRLPPEKENSPPPKPKIGFFLTFFSITSAIIFSVMQMNGQEIHWQASAAIYVLAIIGMTWSFAVHLVPNRGKVIRLGGSSIIMIALGYQSGSTPYIKNFSLTQIRLDRLF